MADSRTKRDRSPVLWGPHFPKMWAFDTPSQERLPKWLRRMRANVPGLAGRNRIRTR